MEYDFKKLNAVDILEEVTDAATILVEEDGKIKRTPKSKMVPANVATTEDLAAVEEKIPTDTVTPEQLDDAISKVSREDMMYTAQEVGRMVRTLREEMPTHDWESLEGKPFGTVYPEVVIEWDGNTEGIEVVNGSFYHVSDFVLPDKDPTNFIAEIYLGPGEPLTGTGHLFGDVVSFPYSFVKIALKDNAEEIIQGFPTVVYPKKGVYFISSIPKFVIPERTESIDDSYISSRIARLTDIPEVTWDSLEGRPFGYIYSFNIYSAEQDESIDVITTEEGYRYVKIDVQTRKVSNQLIRFYITTDVAGEHLTNWRTCRVEEVEYDRIYAYDYDRLVCIEGESEIEYLDITFSPGVWVRCGETEYVSRIDRMDFVQLDESYIPSTIARVDQIPEHTWNTLRDKPFGEETTTVYEGELGSGYDFEIVDSYGTRYHPNGATLRFTFSDGTSQTVDGEQEYASSPSIYNDGDLSVTIDPNNQSVVASVPNDLTIVKIEEVEIDTLDKKFIPKATAIADVTEAPTAEQFNALLASLRAAGYLAE